MRTAITAVAVLILAVAGLVYLAARFPAAASLGWLAAALGWVNVAAGALACSMIARLVRGAWSDEFDPLFRRAAALLPLAALFLLPILFMQGEIYPWASHPLESRAVAFKATWLQPAFFAGRTLVYFAIWCAFAIWLRRTGGDRAVSALGLIVFALTSSLAAVDWQMSLDPEFRSSTFGVLVIAQQLLAGLSWVLLVQPGGTARGNPGGILLSALLLWAYLHAMQYVVIWSGDIPAERHWYIVRVASPWDVFPWLLALVRFAVPFPLLLKQDVRHSRRFLRALAGLILLTGFAETAWFILPLANEAWVALAAWLLAMFACSTVWALSFFVIGHTPVGAGAHGSNKKASA